MFKGKGYVYNVQTREIYNLRYAYQDESSTIEGGVSMCVFGV